MRIERCRWCRAAIRFLKHYRTQRPAPVNLRPDPEGAVVILENGRYMIAPADSLDSPHAREHLYSFHGATCPREQAERERRRDEAAHESYEAQLRRLGEREP